MSGLLFSYGRLALVPVPAVKVNDTDFAGSGDYTPAAADVEFSKGPLQPYATLSILKLAFTSGSEKASTDPGLEAGDSIDGATSGADATVGLVNVTSGSWGAGTAAGDVWIYDQTGTFESENLDVGSDANIATISGDSVAGHLLNTDVGDWFAILTPTEMQFGRVQGHACFGRLNLIDADLEHNAVYIGTIGSPSATFPRVEQIQATYLIPSSVDLADTATVRFALALSSQVGDLPSTAEITPGTISIDFKAIGATSWTSIVSDAAMSEAEGVVYYDEAIASGDGYAEGGSIRVTMKGVSVVVGDDTYAIVPSAGISCQTEVRQTMRGTNSANTTTPPTVGEIQAELEEVGASILDTLRDRLTLARAGYLDNLNIGGNVASSAEATSIQNNTRVVRVVPSVIERPDSGTTPYRVELFVYDASGNMEAPDSAPTIELVDQGGTDLSSRLDSATMTLVETGRYRATYTASDSDDIEQLVWTFSVVEGGNTRKYGNGSIIVDTTAVDFTSADRTTLDTLAGKVVGTIASGTHNPQSGDAYARLGAPDGASVSEDIAAIPTAAENADAVLDEAMAGHVTAGSLGKAVADVLADTASMETRLPDALEGGRISATTGSASNTAIKNAVLNALLSAHTEVGSVGAALGDLLDGGRLDLLIDEILTRLPAATVDGLTPTQLMATLLASAAGRIPDKTANPMVIQNPAGTQARISSTTDRASVTLDHTGA